MTEKKPGTRTFDAMEYVDLGDVNIVDFPEVSASEQARVLVKLLREANGADGTIAERFKYPIVKLAGRYQSEETVKKALRALRDQGIVNNMSTIKGCIVLTIAAFVYDPSVLQYETNATRIEPRKRTRGRKANSTSPEAESLDGAARQSDRRPAPIKTAPRAGDDGAARQSDMRPAPIKTAPRADDIAPRAGDDGAARQVARAQSSVITADQSQLLRDQETMRRDFEGERLGDPERQLGDPGRQERREEPRQENGPGTVPTVSGEVTKVRITQALESNNDPLIIAHLRKASPEVILSLSPFQRSMLASRRSIPRELWDLNPSGENAA